MILDAMLGHSHHVMAMPQATGSALYGALFLAGLVGSLTHCAGMCGPFVLTQVGAGLETVPAAKMTEWTRLRGALLIPYHLGRFTTYVLLGASIKEIVRQIRLRDLGGIIIIDFIDMDERRNRQKVMQALEEALRGDRAPSKVLQFNDFGLVAITRKRVKHSLERTLGTPCPYCTGTGLVKSVETVCNEIYIEMKKLRRQLEGSEILLRVNPEVAKELKANNARWLNDLEELSGKSIIIKPDASLHQEQFDM